jgi:hypothetical protein
MQVPPTQVAPTGHVAPHPPQFATLAWTSMQAPSQYARPPGHVQLPALQCAPPAQATPQAPQFKSSAFRSTHDWLPQIESPHGQQFEVGQPDNTQAPATQKYGTE